MKDFETEFEATLKKMMAEPDPQPTPGEIEFEELEFDFPEVEIEEQDFDLPEIKFENIEPPGM